MILRLIAVGIAILVAGALLPLVVHPGIRLLRSIVGRDRCFGDDALNGCGTWLYGTFICGAIVFLGFPSLGFWSLVFVPLVTVGATFFWATFFTLKAMRMRRREFTVCDADVLRRSDGIAMEPEYAIKGTWEEQTGPATSYLAFVIQLGIQQDIVATNIYIDGDLANEDLAKVMETAGPKGCRQLDVCFVIPGEPQQWQVVQLHHVWTPLLCGSLENLTDADRAWWRKWCQPEFGTIGRATIESSAVREKLERLVAAYPWVADRHPDDRQDHDQTPTLNQMTGTVRPRDNVLALRALLSRGDSISIVTSRAHWVEIERDRGERGIVSHSFDDEGVEFQAVQHFT